MVDTSMSPEQAQQGRAAAGVRTAAERAAAEDSPTSSRSRCWSPGGDLTDAQPGFDQRTGEPIVSFRFNTSGARKFAQATPENVGRPFAIVLDNKVISAPVIREPIIGGQGQISGSFTVAAGQRSRHPAARRRAAGAADHRRGAHRRARAWGRTRSRRASSRPMSASVLVIVFMLLTYGLFGFFANVAVLINVAMIFGMLSLLNATLTLPGIAGIVLTVGIAVDSNVLIYERIREEVRAGTQRRSRRSTPGSPARSRPFSTPTSPPSSPPPCCSTSAPARCAALP